MIDFAEKDFRVACDKFIKQYTDLAKQNVELKQQNAKTISELTDERIAQLEERYETLRKSAIDIFPLVEMHKWRAFKLKHEKECKCLHFTHESGSTAIVNYFSIKCPKCEEELTIYN